MFTLTKIDYFNHPWNKIKERVHSHTNVQKKLKWYVVHFRKFFDKEHVIDDHIALGALESHQRHSGHTYEVNVLPGTFKQAILCKILVIFYLKKDLEFVSFF